MTSAQTGLVLHHLRRLAETCPQSGLTDWQLLERFTTCREESAFAALVRRLGPMVLNVCRSILRHEQDAEDAFQATFLVLARKADTIQRREAVAGWLYEVAHRVAVKALADTGRRRAREQRASPMASVDPTLDMTLRDLRRVLHEELRQLPDKYRLPLMLCYLEGRSHEEAAAQLGWGRTAFRGRLDRGREQLRRRLAARGVAFSAILCATAVAPAASAEGLVNVVVRAALPSSGNGSAAGAISVRAAALTEGVIHTMQTSKLKIVTALLLAVALLAGAGALTHQTLAARQAAPARQQAFAPKRMPELVNTRDVKPPADDKEVLTYAGRVLGPDGQPVVGARLFLTLSHRQDLEPVPESATTGPDGRFAFTAPKARFGEHGTIVSASAARYGVGWVAVPSNGKRNDLTIHLVEDDIPLAGQIVDLEGKPIAGVTLTVLQVNAASGEDLGPWLEAVAGRKELDRKLEQRFLERHTVGLATKVTTDAEGRLRLTGIGRNRLVVARLDGPTIASQQLHLLTRSGKPFEVTHDQGNPDYGEPRTVTTYHGASFRIVAAPTRPVVGVVRDKDTKQPIPGVTIQTYVRHVVPGLNHMVDIIVRATTDADGRYRLVGLPKSKDFAIVAIPPGDQPYLFSNQDVPDNPGLEAVTVDFALKRGVWIEGQITDKVTGKPLKGAVEYFSLYSNPHLAEYAGFDGSILHDHGTKQTKADGSYRVVGLPGPGLIGVYYQKGSYLRAPDREDEFGTKERSFETSPYHMSFTSNYNALARIDPAKGAVTVKRDITLDSGWSVTVTVLGPDGSPLAGTLRFGQEGAWEVEKAPEFRMLFNPKHPWQLLLKHPEKGLIGVAQLPKENNGKLTVRLEPATEAVGRLLDPDGKPRAGVELEVSFFPKGWGNWKEYAPEAIKTDREGRFRIPLLLPETIFRLTDDKGEMVFTSASGSDRTKDLGAVQLKSDTKERE
jgi:RNA polymerase sigma factor (sigma-70 family)